MICPTCGADNAEGAAFCYNCSNPLPQSGPPGWAPPPPGGAPGAPPPGPPMGPGTPVPPGPPAQPPAYPAGFQPGPGGQPPIKPPSRMNAGLAGLVAFVAVLAIGLLVFFVFLNKGDKDEAVASPTTSAATTTTSPTQTTTSPVSSSAPSSSSSSAQNNGNGGGGKTPRLFVLTCTAVSGGLCKGSAGDTPPFVRNTRDVRLVLLLGLFNVPQGVRVTADVLDASTGTAVVPAFNCTTSGASPFRCRFVINPPAGGFPQVTLEVQIRANGTVVNPDNAPNGVTIRFTPNAPV